MKENLEGKIIDKFLKELKRVLSKYSFELKELKRKGRKMIIIAEKHGNSRQDREMN